MATQSNNSHVNKTECEQDGELESLDCVGEEFKTPNDGFKELRIIRKARRPSDQEKSDGNIINGVAKVSINGRRMFSQSKNSRRSRNNNKGRGLPKKGGAGGKGVWGLPGAELGVTEECSDKKDPNYDSDSQDQYVVQKIVPVLEPDEVEKNVEPLIREYLEHGDANEFLDTIDEFNIGSNFYLVLKHCIIIGMDRHDPQRELISELISCMYTNVLFQEDVSKGFDELLNSLSDLTLDTPNAPELLGKFIARAIADDCLPPKYVESYKGKVDCPQVRMALSKADVLLNMKHGIVRLDNIWGVGGGTRPVKSLINRMVLLLEEYLSSADVEEATRCLKELDVPHFHHELVYESVVMALEQASPQYRHMDRIIVLLKSLTSTNVITPDQFTSGMKRVYESMSDISLDLPAAYMFLDNFGEKAKAAGILSTKLYNDMPTRGRKRFVSEGDGGKIKTNGGVL